MNRKALIIGSAPKTQTDAPGVKRDMSTWESFLKSPHGGAWSNEFNEIVTLYNPTKKQVLKEIVTMRIVDYSIIVFLGHGYVKKDFLGLNETILILNEIDVISERELNPGNNRCMIFIDCCRLEESEGEEKTASKTESFSRELNLIDNYRQVYEDAISKCENGCIKIYAASIDEEADDTDSFSKILLRIVDMWHRENVGLLTIDNAMKLTIAFFYENFPQQNPRYQGGRRLHHFPFAINLTK